MQKKTILFVDDDDMLLRTYRRMFSKEFSVVTASNVREARILFENEVFEIDLVVTDFDMPGGTGADMISYVRDHRPTAKVILCSARVEEDLHGADVKILKPDPRGLIREVKRLTTDEPIAPA